MHFAMPDARLEEKCRVETRKAKVIFVQFYVSLCRIRHNERLEFLGDAVLELICRYRPLMSL